MNNEKINEIYEKLTDDNVDDIVDKLKELRKNSKELEILENTSNIPMNYKEDDNKKMIGKFTIDNNGMEQISNVREIEDIPEEIKPDSSNVDIESLFEEKINYNKDNILKDIKNEHKLSDEDTLILFNLMMDDSSNDKNLYLRLPEKVRKEIDLNTGDNNNTKNKFARFLLNEMKQSYAFESSLVEINDTIQREMDMSKLNKSIIEETDDHFTKKLQIMIDSIEDSGNNKYKKEKIKKAMKSYEDSKTYERIKTVKLFTGKFKNKKDFLKNESKLMKAYLSEFNNRYKNHRFGINDINSFYHILFKLFPDINKKYINYFMILFCIYCRKLKVNNIEDHIFMYYSIKHILNVYDMNDMESEYSKVICNNFRNIIEYIKSL